MWAVLCDIHLAELSRDVSVTGSPSVEYSERLRALDARLASSAGDGENVDGPVDASGGEGALRVGNARASSWLRRVVEPAIRVLSTRGLGLVRPAQFSFLDAYPFHDFGSAYPDLAERLVQVAEKVKKHQERRALVAEEAKRSEEVRKLALDAKRELDAFDHYKERYKYGPLSEEEAILVVAEGIGWGVANTSSPSWQHRELDRPRRRAVKELWDIASSRARSLRSQDLLDDFKSLQRAGDDLRKEFERCREALLRDHDIAPE